MSRSVSRDGIAASLELRFARRASASFDAALFAPFDGAPRSETQTVTRMFGSADVNMKGFIFAGHEAPVELYVLGGVGVVQTKPVSLMDPAVRRFGYSTRVAATLGFGARYHFSRIVGVYAEGRLTPYIDQHENRFVSALPAGVASRSDPNTWSGEKPLVTMVSLQAGLLFFLP